MAHILGSRRTAGIRVKARNVHNDPVILCLCGAAANLYAGLLLRKFKVSEIPPRSRAHLSREERQQKITIARRLTHGIVVWLLAGAALLAFSAK